MKRIRKRFGARVRARAARRGVTIVELIVASTILMLGLLSIVGISSSVARALGQSRSDNLAAVAAQSRFERIAGTSCSSMTLGTVTQAVYRGVTERYIITDAGNNIRQIIDSVSWKTAKTTRRAVFMSLIPCRPGA